TDKVNIWREVSSSGSGLVEPDDAPGVERLLRRFHALSSDERSQMGRRARATFLDRFEVGKASASINAACLDAIQAHERRPAVVAPG
ncbi:MAG: hypothetical protein JO234_14550, partial [Hyphomicrobiales bacterium]|nr:hypothetical protein [Hyphomicrobiales bacterium]